MENIGTVIQFKAQKIIIRDKWIPFKGIQAGVYYAVNLNIYIVIINNETYQINLNVNL